jgi:photosystem II stability/assembly factor-like uncharacterized protein
MGGSNTTVAWSPNRGANWFTGKSSSLTPSDTITFVKHVAKDQVTASYNSKINAVRTGFEILVTEVSRNRNGILAVSGGQENMEDAYFFPYTGIGVMVGQKTGGVYRSTDAGYNWTPIFCPNGSFLYRVDFADSQTGYAIGRDGSMFKSTNAGLSWTSVPTNWIPIGTRFTAIDFVTPLIGYLGTNTGAFKTTDGGISFNRITNSSVRCLAFWTVNDGFVSSFRSGLARTTDGGQTFIQDPTIPFYDISCDKQGYCFGINNRLYIYNNQQPVGLEETWTQEASFYPSPLPSGQALQYYLPAGLSYQIQVVSLEGKTIYQQDNLEGGKGELPVYFPTGLYIVKLQAGGKHWQQKVIVY